MKETQRVAEGLRKVSWWNIGAWPGRIGRHEFATLLLVLAVAAGLWGFVELAGEVAEGSTATLDQTILLLLRNPSDPADPLGPRWLEQFAGDVTALGSVSVLVLLTLAVVVFLYLQRKTHAAALVLTAIGGGALLSTLLKLGFGRPRPDLVPHVVEVHTLSFPSGHAMLAAVTYLTLGALLARTQPQARVKAYVLLLAVLLTLLVGLSRVYLGVHWPTDVLAGWMIGAAWAMFCWLAARWLQRRGKVERDFNGNRN